jgi:hypothetical protein
MGIAILIVLLVVGVVAGIAGYYYFVDKTLFGLLSPEEQNVKTTLGPLSESDIILKREQDGLLSVNGSYQLSFDKTNGRLTMKDVTNGKTSASFSEYKGIVYKIPTDGQVGVPELYNSVVPSASINNALAFNKDTGLLAIVNQNGQIVWKANLDNRYKLDDFKPYELVIQDDGNCVIYSVKLAQIYGKGVTSALWASGNPPTNGITTPAPVV